jgi:hypothetical protein
MHITGSLWGDSEANMLTIVGILQTRFHVVTSKTKSPFGGPQLNFFVAEEKEIETLDELFWVVRGKRK